MFSLQFTTNNEAFGIQTKEIEHEIGRILDDLADKVRAGRSDGPVMDCYGNIVGQYNTTDI